jgi:membrane associated rhomboid family serine protease
MNIVLIYVLLSLLNIIFLIPLKDDRGWRRGFPWMTASLVAINVLIHIGLEIIVFTRTGESENFRWQLLYPYMQIPRLIFDREGLGAFSTLTSMFLHGGWGHLIGNMVALWFFGRKVEDMTGAIQFGLFYLLCGFAAGLMSVVANILLFSGSAGTPALGASGAISGVMGAYLFLHSDEKVLTLAAFSIPACLLPIPIPFRIPAWVFLVHQFSKDALLGQLALEVVKVEQDFSLGIGVFAHLGGAVAGLIFIYLFLHPQVLVYRPE